jgi:hypothetical protein
MGDIERFKEDTDRFLLNTYNIYRCNGNDFSIIWHIEVSADRGEPKKQLKTFIFNEYDTFMFYMLANIALNLDDYIEYFGEEFLGNMLFAFETNDNTGLFPIEKNERLKSFFEKNAGIERDTGRIDYRLSNTTLRAIVDSRLKKKEMGGSKKTYKRTKKRGKSKRRNKQGNKKTRKHYIKRK